MEAVRKALYLEPQLALGHATLVALYSRLDRREDAERARQNALRALDGLDDEHPLRGVETMTAGGLRQALAAEDADGLAGRALSGSRPRVAGRQRGSQRHEAGTAGTGRSVGRLSLRTKILADHRA